MAYPGVTSTNPGPNISARPLQTATVSSVLDQSGAPTGRLVANNQELLNLSGAQAAAVPSQLPAFNTWSPATAQSVIDALKTIYNHEVARPASQTWYPRGPGTASSSGTTVTLDAGGSTVGLQRGMRPMILSGTGVFTNSSAGLDTYVQSVTNSTQFVLNRAPSTPLSGAAIWAGVVPRYQFGVTHGEPSGNVWEGCCNLPNGLVVLNPLVSSQNVGLYDPVAGTYMRGPVAAGIQQTGSTLGPDNKVYFSSQTGTTLYRYDPMTNIFGSSGISSTAGASGGIVQGPDGRLVAIPVTQANIDIFDVLAGTKTAIAHGLSGGSYFSSGTVGVDGRIYMAPYGAAVPNVGIVDLTTNTFSSGASCITDAATASRYEGAVVMRSGNICFVPNRATRIGIYNPIANTWRDGPLHVDVSAVSAFTGGTLLPDGRVLMFPRGQGYYGIYDEVADTFLLGPYATAWGGSSFTISGVMTPNGTTVAAGQNAAVQILNFGPLPPAVAAMCTHPLYNKQ
jgi:hypothetical protein